MNKKIKLISRENFTRIYDPFDFFNGEVPVEATDDGNIYNVIFDKNQKNLYLEQAQNSIKDSYFKVTFQVEYLVFGKPIIINLKGLEKHKIKYEII